MCGEVYECFHANPPYAVYLNDCIYRHNKMKSFSIHEPSDEAKQTIESILTPGAKMKLMPTHCINSAGELEGFMLTVPGKDKGSILPINRTMFHGTSLFECAQGAGSFNADVMRLQQVGNTKELMCKLLDEILEQSKDSNATFRCVPDNVDMLSSVKPDGEAYITRTSGKRSVDFADWKPEMPYSIGLYQAFCRGYQKDVRAHKLFIGVSGGLNRCCDEFYNLLQDVGNEFTCQEVAFSEETWWLRKACQRARCRIALMAANHFELSIPTCIDMFSFNQEPIGIPLCDTVEFDIKEASDDTVEFYSACTDTTAVQNGILCRMHESEGMWVFRGGVKSSAKATSFGALFGSKAVCGVFPTRSPYYRKNLGSQSFVNGLDTELIVRHSSTPRTKADGYVFQCFDEQYFSNLGRMQWDRNSGVIELVPIVVGVP